MSIQRSPVTIIWTFVSMHWNSKLYYAEEQYELQVILIKLYYIFFFGFWDLFVHSEWIWGRVWPLTSCLIFSNWVVILWFLFNQTLKTLNRKKQVTFNVKIQTSQNSVYLWMIVSLWLNRRHYHLYASTYSGCFPTYSGHSVENS